MSKQTGFIVKVTTSDGETHTVEKPTLERARRIAQIYTRTGFSTGDLIYSPAHTVKVEIIRPDPTLVREEEKASIDELLNSGSSK